MRREVFLSGINYIFNYLELNKDVNMYNLIGYLNNSNLLDNFSKELIKSISLNNKNLDIKQLYSKNIKNILKNKIKMEQVSLEFIKLYNLLERDENIDFYTSVGALIFFSRHYFIDEMIIFMIILSTDFKENSEDIIKDLMDFLFYNQNVDGSFYIKNSIDNIQELDSIDEDKVKFISTLKIVIGLFILEELGYE